MWITDFINKVKSEWKTDLVAQLAHIGWGGLIAYGVADKTHSWLVGCIIAILFAIVKESIESIWGGWEAIQPWIDGEVDMLFFFLGTLIATVIYLV